MVSIWTVGYCAHSKKTFPDADRPINIFLDFTKDLIHIFFRRIMMRNLFGEMKNAL